MIKNILKNTIKVIKGKVVSGTGKATINYKIRKFGEMLEFKFDPIKKTIYLDLMLKGEDKSITIKVNKFKINSLDNNESELIIEDAEFSREWMKVVFEEFAQGNKIKIPKKSASLLKLIM